MLPEGIPAEITAVLAVSDVGGRRVVDRCSRLKTDIQSRVCLDVQASAAKFGQGAHASDGAYVRPGFGLICWS
jgi:hypothetical protein